MKYLNKISISTAVFATVFTAGVVIAWTGPTLTAPSGNVSTPLNVTATSQVKAGGLWAASVGSDSGYCIGASCISVWPSPQLLTSGTSAYYNTGNVGVGTTTPGTILSVQGVANFSPATTTLYSIGGIDIRDGCFAINGVCIGMDPWTRSGSTIYNNNTGDVGIGTVSPQAKLDINGFMRLAPQSSPGTCNASYKGAIAISNINGRPCICNGSTWRFDYDGSACVWASTAGSQTYSSPGTHNFTIPVYSSLTVEVWGGGQEGIVFGMFSGDSLGAYGSASSFNGTVIANGGGGYNSSSSNCSGHKCAGGTASGGDLNIRGGETVTDGAIQNATGGSAPYGAVGTYGPGTSPGAGGGATGCASGLTACFGGGSGGYAKKTYSIGQLTSGSSVQVVVGSGGSSGAPAGAPGMVKVTWN
jgi:hypothetical protein